MFNKSSIPEILSRVSISNGDVIGVSFIHKFGDGGDIDTGDGFVDIWDGAEDVNADKTYTFSTSADIDSLSSSDASDTEDIEIQGLDSNWDLVTQTITLTGQTRVALTTSLIRVFRMKNVGSNDLAGNVYCYVNGAISGGVPTTSGDIRAIINNGNNQTLMAIYTIPNDKIGFLCSFYASLSKKKDALSNIQLKFRENGSVFQIKHINTLSNTGTSKEQHFFDIPIKIPEKTDILISADTNADNNGVSAGFDIVLIDN